MWGTYTNTVTVRRKTAWLLEPTAVAQTLSLAFQPVEACPFQVGLQGGTAGTGEVYVTGLSAGVTVTEVLTFAGPGYRQTARAFSTVGITTSGLADEPSQATISVKMVGHDGSPQSQPIALAVGYPACIDDTDEQWPNLIGGGHTQGALATITLPFSEVWTPRGSDLLTDEHNRVYSLLESPPGAGGMHPYAWVCRARRFEAEP